MSTPRFTPDQLGLVTRTAESRDMVAKKTIAEHQLTDRMRGIRDLVSRTVSISLPKQQEAGRPALEHTAAGLASSISDVIDLYRDAFHAETQIYDTDELHCALQELFTVLQDCSESTPVGTLHRRLIGIATLIDTAHRVLIARGEQTLASADILERDRLRSSLTTFSTLSRALNSLMEDCNRIGGTVMARTKIVKGALLPDSPLIDVAWDLFKNVAHHPEHRNWLVREYERLVPDDESMHLALHDALTFLSTTVDHFIKNGGNLSWIAAQMRTTFDRVIRPAFDRLMESEEASLDSQNNPPFLVVNIDLMLAAFNQFFEKAATFSPSR